MGAAASRRARHRAEIACAAFIVLFFAACSERTPSAYERELAQMQRDIAQLRAGAFDAERGSVLIDRLYRYASLTGSVADFKAAASAIEDAFARIGPLPAFYFLRAHLSYRFHRLAEARSDLEKSSVFAETARWRALAADIDFQQGKYRQAQARYEELVRASPSWDQLARLAHLKLTTGDFDGADRLYAEAQDDISAKEMRAYAWVEVQRGLLDLRRGRHDEALAHYRRAEQAYSGFWFIDEHIAEALGAKGEFAQAIARYRSAIAQSPKPELKQALGDLYLHMGDAGRARPWHEQALAGYLESADAGEVHYYHHLADFYADAREDGAEAATWARRDLALRRNSATHDALAWALYRQGRHAEALAESRKALAFGTRDAHLFFHAAMIHAAAGETKEASRLMAAVVEMNPYFQSFHAHR